MNDHDKAGRYLIKRDPPGFFRWLLGMPDVVFHRWLDSRRVVLPEQADLTSDLVAAFRVGDGFEGLALELQAEARADTLGRMLGYVLRLWTEPAPGGLDLAAVGGVVVNLTRRTAATELVLRPTVAPSCRLELAILQRNLRDDSAAELVAGVAAGRESRWLLGWVPLLNGGADSGIISAWLREAKRVPEERARADLGLIAITFAGLARCRPAWEQALQRWNMVKSELWEEIRSEARQEGREEGREEGRLMQAREAILRLGQRRFRKAATRKQQADLAALSDLARLQRIQDRLLDATSWTDLLATP